jgi:molybdate transport system substrate-binding protein
MKFAFIVATATAILFSSGIASASEMTLLSVGAAREIIVELIPEFEKNSGHKVVATWSGSANVKERIAAGETYDLVVVGVPVIDAFIKEGKIVAGSRVDLFKSGVGVAVRAGAPKPDIGSSEGLKQTLIAARSVGYSSGPSGDHLLSLIERMGISDRVKPKLKQVSSGVRIGTMIAGGEVEIGFQQISELIHAPGLDYLGPLPPDVQLTTVYSSGILSGAKQPEAAKTLVKFLTTPAAGPVIRQHGMEPG